MIDLLIILLKPALRAADQGSRNPLDVLALLVVFPLDILIAHTTWAAVAGWPQRGEWTISQTLPRLVRDTTNHDRDFYLALARRINSLSPGHIRLD